MLLNNTLPIQSQPTVWKASYFNSVSKPFQQLWNWHGTITVWQALGPEGTQQSRMTQEETANRHSPSTVSAWQCNTDNIIRYSQTRQSAYLTGYLFFVFRSAILWGCTDQQLSPSLPLSPSLHPSYTFPTCFAATSKWEWPSPDRPVQHAGKRSLVHKLPLDVGRVTHKHCDGWTEKTNREGKTCCWQTTLCWYNSLSDQCRKPVTLTVYRNHFSNFVTDMEPSLYELY